MKKVEYTVVRENTLHQLEKQVRKLTEKGWKPKGGIAASNNIGTDQYPEVYAQALTRKIKGDK